MLQTALDSGSKTSLVHNDFTAALFTAVLYKFCYMGVAGPLYYLLDLFFIEPLALGRGYTRPWLQINSDYFCASNEVSIYV